MFVLKFIDIKARLHDGRILRVADWQPKLSEYWAITGTNGSGKTALSLLPANRIILSQGVAENLPIKVSYLSLEAQAEYIENERKLDQSDINNEYDPGTLISVLLAPIDPIKHWIAKLRIEHVLNQGLRSLSTGESRKVLLLKALQDKPELLVLDAPFEGLDADSRIVVKEILDSLRQQQQPMLWVANRVDEMPDWITHIAFMHEAELIAQGLKDEVLGLPEVHGLLHFDKPLADFPPTAHKPLLLAHNEPLVRLTDVSIRYGERTLLEHLNWQVKVGEHWAIQGPNGSGKTSLLQLITGDNSQCYTNNLKLFGIQRGTGESIWDIKKHIGLVSSSLQWEYRASTNVLTTVISGLYDSIGLYQASGDDDKQLALKWLDIIGLGHKANQSLHKLSYGEQRLVLVARALIKQPPLLILDEPCQGLDTPSRLLVLAFINKLAQQRKITLLYVTHQANEIPASINNKIVFELQESGISKIKMTTS